MNFRNSRSFAPEGSWRELMTTEEGCGKGADFFDQSADVDGLKAVCGENERSL
jgi:hypothetical protein